MYFLTWAWPYQGSQCLRPMGVPELSRDANQRDVKGFLRLACEYWQWAGNIHHRFSRNDVCSRQTTHSSAKTVPTRLAKSTSLFSCIRYPTSLFICLQWLCLPVQLWMVKTLSCLYPGCYIFSIWEPRPPDTNFSVSICLSFPHSLITPSQGSWNQAMQGHNSSGLLKPTTILPRYK